MKRYFLGLAASNPHPFRHLFKRGGSALALTAFLEQKYQGKAILYKNGRTALASALKAYLPKKARVIVNGFTCYAVVEAVRAAGMTPVFVDINAKTLNFDLAQLNLAAKKAEAIIIQNTLGIPVEITHIENLAKKHHLVLIEDLAHSAGISYPDGREAGTVGDAAIFSFGKDKAVDTILGGAAVFKNPNYQKPLALPTLPPRKADNLRARLYPVLGLFCRKLTGVRLSGPFMWLCLKLHLVEKSADNFVDFDHQIAPFEATLALEQFKKFKNHPLREFFLVENRDQVLKELKAAGYYFESFWYETPVSPRRYYQKSGFNPENCPVAVQVSHHILNFPNYYTATELAPALKIVKRAKKWEEA